MNLKAQAARGALWMAAATVVGVVLQLLQVGVLSRILTPGDFGLMALVLIVVGFSRLFADLGVSQAIIYRHDATPEQLASLYWLNIMAGIVVFLIVIVLSPVLASIFQEPELGRLIRIAAIGFLVAPIGQQFQMLLQRALRFKQLAIIEIVSTVLGVASALIAAYAGWSVMSLVLGFLVLTSTKAAMLLLVGISDWRPGFRFRFDDVRSFIAFGLYQIGEKTINYFNERLDQILIGVIVGSEALGYYSIAYMICVLPVTKLNPILNRVAYPVFSRVADSTPRLTRGYLLLLRLQSSINFPLLIGLAVTAPAFVGVMLGDGWGPTVVLLQILALVCLLMTTGNPINSLLLSRGRADLGFKWNAMLIVTQSIGVYTGVVMGGVVGAAVALLMLQMFYFLLNYRFLVKTILGAVFKPYVSVFVWPLTLSVSMAIVVWLVGTADFSGPLSLLIAQVGAGVVTYAALSAWFQRDLIPQVRQMFGRKADV